MGHVEADKEKGRQGDKERFRRRSRPGFLLVSPSPCLLPKQGGPPGMRIRAWAGCTGCAARGRQIFANQEAFAIRQTFAIWHEPAETRSSSPNSVAEPSPGKPRPDLR